jgi:hypothetical protein
MKKILFPVLGLIFLFACNEPQSVLNDDENSRLKSGNTESSTFTLSGSIDIGSKGAAEISAFDPITNRLFVVNNSAGNNRIEVVDFSDPSLPTVIGNINTVRYGGMVNSVSVSNGKLAAAIEATIKTDNGKVLVFNTGDYSVLATVEVGALPDMVTFSPDGNMIITANEGEPNDTYTTDPIGTVSIILVNDNYSVTTLDFSGFESRATELKAKGFRIFGKDASFAQDIEPEYVAVSQNSKKAWVTLQENNGIAVIDLDSRTITDILPLGFKNYNLTSNEMDLSDADGGVFFKPWPVKSVYMPDGIAVLANNNVPFVFTANEGDAREYVNSSTKVFVEAKRINDATVVLDPLAFPNAATLKLDANLGKLNITTTLGNKDGDGDFDELYSFGARSFSVWNGNTGKQIFDSGNELDKRAFSEGNYDDKRSDDKGAEPEGVAVGRVGNKNLLFVGMERVDGVAVYDVTNPVKPKYLQWLDCGDAPEGLLFISAEDSPIGKSLLVVSSEDDGVVTVFETISLL